jgi:hypothetical protein
VTARVLGWVARRLWAPVAIAAAVGIDHTAYLAADTGDPVWVRLRAVIGVAAVGTGIFAVYTTRSTT